jgi:hypothetical protein
MEIGDPLQKTSREIGPTRPKPLIYIGGEANTQAVIHEAEIIKTGMPGLWLPVFILLVALASASRVPSSRPELKSPDLNLIVQRLEDVQHQNRAQSQQYEVTREYKVFHGNDKQPTSEVTVQINFVPPDVKTYKIAQARGSSRGEKMVRELLDRETESAKKGKASEINRANYDFVFLREETFGIAREYVLQIVPKRNDQYLVRGQIWLDASSFRIRRIEGVPAKSPSIWLKRIHIALQFTQLKGMWIPTSFDAIATVRLLGQYTLAGHDIRSSDGLTSALKLRGRRSDELWCGGRRYLSRRA